MVGKLPPFGNPGVKGWRDVVSSWISRRFEGTWFLDSQELKTKVLRPFKRGTQRYDVTPYQTPVPQNIQTLISQPAAHNSQPLRPCPKPHNAVHTQFSPHTMQSTHKPNYFKIPTNIIPQFMLGFPISLFLPLLADACTLRVAYLVRFLLLDTLSPTLVCLKSFYLCQMNSLLTSLSLQ
jgi:hypothetical protein